MSEQPQTHPQAQPSLTVLSPEQPPSRTMLVGQVISSIGVIITLAVVGLFLLGFIGFLLFVLFAA